MYRLIILTSVICFFLMFLLLSTFPQVLYYCILNDIGSGKFYIHQLITHQFIHINIRHLVFNMIGFVILAPAVEKKIGSLSFLYNYLIIGSLSGLSHIIFSDVGLIGASGSIWGIWTLYAMLYPNKKFSGIYIKHLILFLLFVEGYDAFFPGKSNVSHITHFSGGIIGILIYYINKKKWIKKKN